MHLVRRCLKGDRTMENKKALNDEELQAVAGGVITSEDAEEAWNQPKPEVCPLCKSFGLGWISDNCANTAYGEFGFQWRCEWCNGRIVIGKSGKVYYSE